MYTTRRHILTSHPHVTPSLSLVMMFARTSRTLEEEEDVSFSHHASLLREAEGIERRGGARRGRELLGDVLILALVREVRDVRQPQRPPPRLLARSARALRGVRVHGCAHGDDRAAAGGPSKDGN